MSVIAATEVFQKHRHELGFVNQAQCDDGDLYVEYRDETVVGAALANHCVRKPQTTLYELAVLPAYRRDGVASELINRLARDSPHEKIIAKCPVELPANDFYASTGWEQIESEDGKNRELNVWEYEIPDSPALITTGRPDLVSVAERYGWLRGSRLDYIDRHESRGHSVEFVDMHWEDPRPDELLAATMRHRPSYVVAGDYDGDNICQINERARRLRRYADHVIVVPHEPGEVVHVPSWATVGYSTPTKYAGTDAPVWEYSGRDVHILGGTIEQINEIYAHLRNSVVSIDTNTFHRSATQFAKWWGGSSPHWNQLPDVCDEKGSTMAYENAIANVAYALEESGVLSY